MLVDKPPWVSHGSRNGELYGLDCAADGVRFATAGGDHKVKVWALQPVLSAAAEADEAQPKLLATLASHFGAVNALRFSSTGRRLATASDDKLVFVHELRAGKATPVFGSTEVAVENWVVRPAAARRPPPAASRPPLSRVCAGGADAARPLQRRDGRVLVARRPPAGQR